MDDIYNSDRIGHIKNIMGHHAEMAAPGETIYFGLTDDPCQPMTYRNADSRPSGVIQSKEVRPDGTFDISVQLTDGTYRSVNTGTLAPGDLFEYGEDAYARYAEKRREEERARAEEVTLKEPEYSGAGDLAEQVKLLSAKLEDHIQQTQSQNATFVETIAQMANDISTGKAEFSNVFRKEFATFKGTEASEPSPVSEQEYGDVSAVIESSDEEVE